MTRAAHEHRRSWKGWATWAFASLVLLGLGTVLRAGELLVHAHGESGTHVHVLGDVAEEALAEHGHVHAPGAGEHWLPGLPEHAPHPDGVLVALPGPVALAPLGATPGACPPPAACAVVHVSTQWEGNGARAHTGAGPPLRAHAKQRSGTAALLTASHALLL